jgi:two-component system capsular synthesis response regulator RcsB
MNERSTVASRCARHSSINGINILSAFVDKPLRIILADDHPIFLIGLRVVLEHDHSAVVVAQANSPDELLTNLKQHQCDVLVTDFMMPGEKHNDGLRLLQRIRRDFPDLPIIVVTMLNNAGLFRAILDLKVQGLLSKASVAGELPAAIACVRRNRTYIADSVHSVMQEAADHDTSNSIKPLSPRELEVIRLLATGMAVGEIATQLNRSKQTVSAQKVSAMRKLGLANEAALFIYLQENGLG